VRFSAPPKPHHSDDAGGAGSRALGARSCTQHRSVRSRRPVLSAGRNGGRRFIAVFDRRRKYRGLFSSLANGYLAPCFAHKSDGKAPTKAQSQCASNSTSLAKSASDRVRRYLPRLRAVRARAKGLPHLSISLSPRAVVQRPLHKLLAEKQELREPSKHLTGYTAERYGACPPR
jgi:hypothetical protein